MKAGRKVFDNPNILGADEWLLEQEILVDLSGKGPVLAFGEAKLRNLAKETKHED